MAMKKMYFGNETRAQWVPCPERGMTATRNFMSAEVLTDNGGLWIDDSAAGWLAYSMDFPVKPINEYEGIEAFDRFRAREYGPGFLRFIDPMIMEQNLFNQGWAAPGLAEQGHKSIYDNTPTYVSVATNSFGKPLRSAVFDVTSAANATPVKANSTFTLLIPPGYKIALGATGVATGTAKLRVQPVNLDGSLAAVQDVTLTADAAAPSLSSIFSGNTYKAIRVYITRTSTAASTLTLNSLMAQCYAVAATVPTPSRFIPGKGHSGLKFQGTGRVYTYGSVARQTAGAVLTLAEVEPWAPLA